MQFHLQKAGKQAGTIRGVAPWHAEGDKGTFWVLGTRCPWVWELHAWVGSRWENSSGREVMIYAFSVELLVCDKNRLRCNKKNLQKEHKRRRPDVKHTEKLP